MSGLPGRDCSHADHVCGMCHGKAAKRFWRVWVKRQKTREKRAWKSDYEKEH